MNAMEEQHLTIETLVDGKRIDKHAINDPFLTCRIEYEPSIWDRIKLFFKGKVQFIVRVNGDREAIRHWFRTDKYPGEDHEPQTTAQNAPTGEQPGAPGRPPS